MAFLHLCRRLRAGILSVALATAAAPAGAGPLPLPSQAPCNVNLGIIHIGLRHATGGKCAGTPAPRESGGSQAAQRRGAASGSGSQSYVAGYSRTCSTQDGHDVCVARSGSHVSTCTKYNATWRCTETSRKTAVQAACEARAAHPVPSGPTIRSASYSMATANAYYQAHNWKALLAYADGWTQAEPRNANAWMILGNTYGVGIRNDDAAAAAFRQTIAVKPSWALPYVGLGHAYLNEKCFDLAGAALEKAADRNRGSALYWKNAAAAYSYAGRLDLADEMLINEQQHLAHPDAIDWYNIGSDFNKIEDPAHAAAALHRSVALNARYANAWNNLGVADENLDKFDQALAEYKKAAALGDSLGSSNVAHLQALIAQIQRASHRRGGRGGGSYCYDGATTVAANGASGACPPGFGVHQGDRSDDSTPSSEPASEPEPVAAPPASDE